MIRKILAFCFCWMGLAVVGQPTVYQTPSMAYNHHPEESITDFNFSNPLLEDVQSAIDRAKSGRDKNIVRITLSGNLYISTKPLVLYDRMILVLNNGAIKAASNMTSLSLISLENASYVSIAAIGGEGLIDGGGKYAKGISIVKCGKVHLDNLKIINCKKSGIDYLGKGAKVYADAGSITRCNIQNCGDIAVSIADATHFIFTDNQVFEAVVGLRLNAHYAAITHNSIMNCASGLEIFSQFETIAYNNISNCGTGIVLSETNAETLLANNKVVENKLGFQLNGAKAKLYNNRCNNAIEIVGKGVGHLLFANRGITTVEGEVEGCLYFNPPTVGYPHNDLIKIGKGRSDITLTGVPFRKLRVLINQAHASHPHDVIVIHLEGDFLAEQYDSLTVREDECFLMNGRIHGKAKTERLICFKGNTTTSFSGGSIDGDTTNGTNSLVHITGDALVVLDSVEILHAMGGGISKQYSSLPSFVRACSVSNCQGKGLWLSEADKLFAFDNRITRCNADGINLDAFTTQTVLMHNYSCNNKRYGIGIQEGAFAHTVIGNVADSNQAGIALDNQNSKNYHTSYNLLAANQCNWNNSGIYISALEANKATTDNLLFNNTCTHNNEYGMGGYETSGKTNRNYNAMNTVKDNFLASFPEKAAMEANPLWNSLAITTTLPIDLISFAAKAEKKNGITLTWETAREVNTKSFELERSTNLKEYTSLGELAGAGNANHKMDYHLLDTNARLPIQFYRIKMLDNDGHLSYSRILPFEIGKDTTMDIQFFNLKSWAFEVNVQTKTSFSSADIQLYSLDGKLMYKHNSTPTKRVETLKHVVMVKDILSGPYVLKVKTENAEAMKKVMITRW